MKCTNCKTTDHEKNALFCHACGTMLQDDNEELEQNKQHADNLIKRCIPFLRPRPRNWEKALPDLLESAILGNARAQLYIGLFFQDRYQFNYNHNNKIGVNPNVIESFRWILSSARLGNSEAQVRVAFNYLYGLYNEPNNDLAFYWSQKSASNNNRDGIALLGLCYVLGIGVHADKVLGDHLIKEAFAKGSIHAKHMLNDEKFLTHEYIKEIRKDSEQERNS